MKRKHPAKSLATIHVPGMPEARVYDRTVAAFLMAQEEEIRRLRDELAKVAAAKDRRIIVPEAMH